MHTCRAGIGRGLGEQSPVLPPGWPSNLPGRLNLLGLCGRCRRMLGLGEKGGKSSTEQPAPSRVSRMHLPPSLLPSDSQGKEECFCKSH